MPDESAPPDTDDDDDVIDRDHELRLYCVVRGDLRAADGQPVSMGKMIAQGGHAFVAAIFGGLGHHVVPTSTMTEQEALQSVFNAEKCVEYLSGHQPKITVMAKNLAAIERAAAECKAAGINHVVITDLGRTVFAGETVTCMGIGPVAKADLPPFVKKFRLLP